ncbi:MAG: PA2779 family protein [Nitrospirae bacterium]|nr:PA2779 family protein [Nitrospirota bacterium]
MRRSGTFFRTAWLVFAVLAFWALVPAAGLAAPVPSPVEIEADRAIVSSALEQQVVRERLAALGLAPEEIQARLDALTPDDIHAIAANVSASGGVEAGGDGAAVLVLVLIIAFLMYLYFSGKRVHIS